MSHDDRITSLSVVQGNDDVGKCDHKVRTLCIEKELIRPREEAVSISEGVHCTSSCNT